MRSILPLLVLTLLPSLAQAEPRLYPADIPLTLGLGAFSLTLQYGVDGQLPVPSFAGQQPQLSGLDQSAIRWDPNSSHVSDVLLYSMIAAPFVVQLIDDAPRGEGWGRAWGRDVLITTEAFFINLAATQMFKYAVRRPRPFLWIEPSTIADPDDRESLIEHQEEADAGLSFPSGHTSSTFALASATITLLLMKHDKAEVPLVIGAVLLSGAALTTGILRVTAGRHHPTDVLAGAFLGTAIGITTPLLHQSPMVPIATSTPAGGGGIALVGRLP